MARRAKALTRRYPTFPWFGKKTKIAERVWKHLGKVERYIEPFGGSLSVLLANPNWQKTFEIANDNDGFVANFFRTVRLNPQALWEYAAVPPTEVDLHSRHLWLCEVGRKRMYRLIEEPEYYDAQTAGYWYFGVSLWIGGQWCLKPDWRKPSSTDTRMLSEIRQSKESLLVSLKSLANRLRSVRILCGDWKRCVTPAMFLDDVTGVFLDPPYFNDCSDTSKRVYSSSCEAIYNEVMEFADQIKGNDSVRAIVCGQGKEYDELLEDGWSRYQWSRSLGYSNHGSKESAGKRRRLEDVYWCSPSCVTGDRYSARSLF